MENVNAKGFIEKLERSERVLADFWASWCGPCRAQAPILEELAKEDRDLEIVKIDVDAEGELAAEYGVMSIPTLIYFEKGKLVRREVGLHSQDELRALVARTK